MCFNVSLYLKYMSRIEGETAVATELEQHHESQGDEERFEDGAVQQLWQPELLPLPILLPLHGVQAQEWAGVVVAPDQDSLDVGYFQCGVIFLTSAIEISDHHHYKTGVVWCGNFIQDQYQYNTV